MTATFTREDERAALAFARARLDECLDEANPLVVGDSAGSVQQAGVTLGTFYSRDSMLSPRLSPLRRASVSGVDAVLAERMLDLLLAVPPQAPFGERLHVHVGSRDAAAAAGSGLFRVEVPQFRLADLIVAEPVARQLSLIAFAVRAYQEVLTPWGWGADPLSARAARLVATFSGPSGTGKTLAAYAVAGELGLPLMEVNYAQLESEYVGRTAKNVELVFSEARRTGSVIFFDEADGFFGKRVTSVRQATDVAVNNTRGVMLMQMDRHAGLIVMSTNLPGNFDTAFRRRILESVEFRLPGPGERARLLSRHLPAGTPGWDALDWTGLAAATDGLSGGEIANVCLRASLLAARRAELDGAAPTIGAADFTEAAEMARQVRRVVGEEEGNAIDLGDEPPPEPPGESLRGVAGQG